MSSWRTHGKQGCRCRWLPHFLLRVSAITFSCKNKEPPSPKGRSPQQMLLQRREKHLLFNAFMCGRRGTGVPVFLAGQASFALYTFFIYRMLNFICILASIKDIFPHTFPLPAFFAMCKKNKRGLESCLLGILLFLQIHC